jgi:hypothetical protein
MTEEFAYLINADKAQLETSATPDAGFKTNILTIVTEATEYWTEALDNRLAFVDKLLGAKSFNSAIEIQSEYAKTSFKGFIAQAKKMGELYSNLAKTAFKPIDPRSAMGF